ncbi:MAG: hypothetical protein K0R38_5891, partial [Polyangiaceae bacterium]|nr:hypothetical protein [Polyangiaceae bacterium]
MLTRVFRWRGAWLGLVAMLVAQGCGDEAASDTARFGTGSSGSSGSSGSTSGGGPLGGAQATSGANGGGGKNSSGGSSSGGKGNSSGASAGGGGSSGNAGSAGNGGGVSGSGAGAGAGAGGSGSANVSKSAGCGKAAPLAGAEQKSVTIGADARGYLLVPPTSYKPDTAYPLVFVFHGGGSAGSLMRAGFTLEAAAQGQAVFVYPDGLGYIWDLKNDGPDAKLFDSMVATLQDGWCVDKNAIFAVGFSYGGWAATQMAKARPTVLRGVVSMAGGGPSGGLASDSPVAAMLVHGMNDTAESPDSGARSRDHFVATNGCATTSQPVEPSP